VRPKRPTRGKEKPGTTSVGRKYGRHIEVANCINETSMDCAGVKSMPKGSKSCAPSGVVWMVEGSVKEPELRNRMREIF
jgi:hypothetical protein